MIHKLHALDVDDAAFLLGKLLGRFAARSCNIDKARARNIVMAKQNHPSKIVEVRVQATRGGMGWWLWC